MRGPVVSIVIPTFNNADLIGIALESVYAQTFTDFEIIVVDDGSTDGTREVLSAFTDRISYHYQPNQGPAAARNKGLRLARGEFIAYLDADDIWHPDNLSIKRLALMSHPDLGGVFSDFAIFDTTGPRHDRGLYHLFPTFRRNRFTVEDVFSHRVELNHGAERIPMMWGKVFQSLLHGNFILPTVALVRREAALAVGDFRRDLRTQEDYEYWLRFAKMFPFAYVDRALAQYRRHPQQLTDHSKIDQTLRAVIQIMDCYRDDWLHHGAPGAYARRKSQLWRELGKGYARHARFRDARDAFRESIRESPLSWSAYVHLLLSMGPYHSIFALHRVWTRMQRRRGERERAKAVCR